MPDIAIVPSFLALLQVFESCFTAPTFRTFQVLACGWVLALGRHTVTTAVRAANATEWKHIRTLHRFFSKSRWNHDALGRTFQETKGKLGLEQPRCRSEQAVERTAPFTLFLYTLVVLWFAKTGCKLRSAQPPRAPWYSPETTPAKTLPAFSDMLATLRRASWAERLFHSDANSATLKKHIEPLLACLDTAA